MPSVGMRRTTRVFGARVLRSGRRLFSGPSEGKHTKAADGEGWIELLDTSGDGGDASLRKENGWRSAVSKLEIVEMDVDEKMGVPELGRSVPRGIDNDCKIDRKWGCFYQRKRKRVNSGTSDFEKQTDLEQRMYGTQFVRKQWRKKARESSEAENAGFVGRRVFKAVVESSSSGRHWFACFLNLVLRYMRRERVRISQLSAFLSSEPLALVFSSHGIHFLLDSPSFKSTGICEIFGARSLIPLFALDFSAVPFCFMSLHSRMLLRFACLPHALVMYFMGMDAKDEEMTDDDDDDEILSCTLCERDSRGSRSVESGSESYGKRRVLYLTTGTHKLASKSVQFRNGVSSRSIQKRRSSLRSRRGRNPSVFGIQKANGALVSGNFSIRRDGIPLTPGVSTRQLRSSVRRSTTTNFKELKSTIVELTQDLDSASCSANIMVIESDRCYREEGAMVTLEISASKQWYIAVKRDGINRYSISAQKLMRPCSFNRVTHDIIWTEDINSWKLEFPNRQDWLVFKELYRECSERNARAPTINTIPVPGVCEVSVYGFSGSEPFARPDSYIRLKDDELSRALAKKTAIYDMDSEDELWLDKLNSESCAESENHERVSEENFELIIDAFEKAFFCSPEDYSDEKAVVSLSRDLARREIVEAVRGYWMKKRKQKRSVLIRIFQLYQPSRVQLIPKSVLRKKRSFKRQPSQSQRGKQRTFLQVMAAAQDAAFDEQSAMLKVQEAKAAVSRSEGLAVLNRRRAQLLVENADLATYRATMALRIAEAAQVTDSSDAAATFFLD